MYFKKKNITLYISLGFLTLFFSYFFWKRKHNLNLIKEGHKINCVVYDVVFTKNGQDIKYYYIYGNKRYNKRHSDDNRSIQIGEQFAGYVNVSFPYDHTIDLMEPIFDSSLFVDGKIIVPLLLKSGYHDYCYTYVVNDDTFSRCCQFYSIKDSTISTSIISIIYNKRNPAISYLIVRKNSVIYQD